MEAEDVHVFLSEDKIEEYREVFSFFDRVANILLSETSIMIFSFHQNSSIYKYSN